MICSFDTTMTTSNEFLNDQNKIRDLIIMSGTLTLGGDKTINCHLKLSGDIDLGSFTYGQGHNALLMAAGNIEITSGNRSITGAAGSAFHITGSNGNQLHPGTQNCQQSRCRHLEFWYNLHSKNRRWQNGFGANNPVTINGILQIAGRICLS